MDDDKKKSSLKGRGREIMGGSPDENDTEATSDEFNRQRIGYPMYRRRRR